MAFSINTNNAAQQALSSLAATNMSLTKTENEVSTGKKINTASDDPAIYAIAQSMNSQVSALSGVTTGLQTTAQVISTASSQASSSSILLSSISQDLTEGVTKGLDATTLNQTISKTLSQIDANSNGATFQGVNLLAGAVSNSVSSTTASSAQDVNGTLFTQSGYNATAAGLGLDGLNVNQSGVKIDLSGATAASFDAANDGSGTVTNGGLGGTITLSTITASNSNGSAQNIARTTTFMVNDGLDAAGGKTTVQDGTTTDNTSGVLASKINAALQTNTSASDVSVSLNQDGSVSGVAGAAGSTATIVKTTNAAGASVYTISKTGSLAATVTESKDSAGNYSYAVSTATDSLGNTKAESVFVSVTSTNTASIKDYTSQLSTAMQNQGFGVSEDATGNLQIAGGNLHASTTAADGSTATSTIGTASVDSGSDYATLAIGAAISQLNKISSALGSSANLLTGLQSTVSTLSNSLTSGVGALTDADMTQESAKLTSLQTKQSLAIQALSIANSQSSSLISLFR